ncbi:MAG: M24 family metallopeptidase, partial [Spirochaetales bacterium]|nr:M24 family metallopeptidase [Spirochaetales bacterium]
LAEKPPEEAEAVFSVITGARDRALALIAEGLEAGRPVTGAEVDRETRAFLTNAGYGAYIAHRTGHGIDTEVHGCGVNLDSVEFPDHRTIIEGSCFSVEPGLYLEHFGLRTEINAYRRNDRVIVSGGPVQTVLLTL